MPGAWSLGASGPAGLTPLSKQSAVIKKEVHKEVVKKPGAAPQSKAAPKPVAGSATQRHSLAVPSHLKAGKKRPSAEPRRSTSNSPRPAATKAINGSHKRTWTAPDFRGADSSEDDTGVESLSSDRRKRAKTSVSTEPDTKRRVRSTKAFAEKEQAPCRIIHSADITKDRSKYKRGSDDADGIQDVLLQYPSACHRERYVKFPLYFGASYCVDVGLSLDSSL